MPAVYSSVFIKKKCYEKFGLFNTNYKIAADYDLLFRFIKIDKIKYIYTSKIIVHMSPGGTSTRNIFSTIKLNQEIIKIHKTHNRPIRIFNLLKKIPVRLKELIKNKNY